MSLIHQGIQSNHMKPPIPSLKLTFSPLEINGWNTIVSFWDSLFSGAFAVSFRECRFPIFKNSNIFLKNLHDLIHHTCLCPVRGPFSRKKHTLEIQKTTDQVEVEVIKTFFNPTR